MVQRVAGCRDNQAFAVEDGCLVLPGGQLPTVWDITSPLLLGVHKARPAAVGAAGTEPGRVVDEHVPVYVPRDVDGELRERVAAGGFVLVVGDSTAGKTRVAFEAVSATVPGHLLIRPENRTALAAAVARAGRARRCVLWLDDLQTYLGSGGLSVTQAGRLLAGTSHHRLIIATLRAAELARLSAARLGGDDAGRQVLGDVRQVLDLAYEITVPRMFTAGEQDRARTRDWDPRIAEALDHAGPTALRSTWPPGRNCCGTGTAPAVPHPARTPAAWR